MGKPPTKPTPSSVDPDTPAPQRPDHHTLGSTEPKPKRRGGWWWLGRLVLLVVLLIAMGLALLPTLLSTGPGTRLLVSLIGPRAGGAVTIDELNLSWFSGQRAKGVVFTKDDGSVVVQVGEVNAKDAGLFALATGGRSFGQIELDNLLVVYDVTPREPSEPSEPRDAPEPAPTPENKPAPAPQPPSTEPPAWLRGLAFDLSVRGAEFRYRAADMAEVKVIAPTLQVALADGQDLTWDAQATVQQGDQVGSFASKGSGLGIGDANGRLQPRDAVYNLTAQANGLPIDGMARILSDRPWSNPAAAYLLGTRGRLAAVLGGQRLSATLTLDGVLNRINADLNVETDNLAINLPLRSDGDRLVVSPDLPDSELRWDWDMTPAGFKALFPKSGLALQGPVRFASRRIEADLPRKGNGIDLDAASLAVVMLGQNATMIDKNGREIQVEDLRLGVTSDSLSALIVGRMEATVTAPDETGQMVAGAVQADLAGRRLFEQDRAMSFVSEKLPIVLIDALGGFEDDLVVWLGAVLDLDVMVQGRVVEDAAGARVVYDFSLLPESSRISGELPGQIDGPRWLAATPDQAPMEIVLRAEGFARLMSLLSGDRDRPVLRFAGEQSMTAYVTINETSYATDPSKPKVWGNAYVLRDRVYTDLTIELTPATVIDPRNQKIYELRSGTFNATISQGQLDGALDVDLWVPPDAGKAGFGAALTLQTTIFELIDTTGKLPLTRAGFAEQIRVDGGINLVDTPSDLFDSLLQKEGDLAAVLGPVVNDMDVRFRMANGKPTGATLRLNWDETINAPIDGAWASMRPIELDIDDQGMMRIADGQDVTLELRVHPELGDRWMGQLHPVLFDAQSGDRPVQVTIKGDSFVFPLGAEGMAGANVEAMVDLGSLEFGGDSLLGRLLSWTGHAGDRAVFNPARVTLTDGIVSYEQLDLSVGNVQIRFDGTLDLNSGEIVEMAMRVPGTSLVRVFNELEGVVPEDDFLSIPMSGTLRDPTFDRQLITREVTRLLTENALRRQRQRFEEKIRDSIGLPPRPAEGAPDGDLAQGQPAPENPAPIDPREEAIERGFDLFRRVLENR